MLRFIGGQAYPTFTELMGIEPWHEAILQNIKRKNLF
jgi:hypothetical protein